jgi:hypothetical protein
MPLILFSRIAARYLYAADLGAGFDGSRRMGSLGVAGPRRCSHSKSQLRDTRGHSLETVKLKGRLVLMDDMPPRSYCLGFIPRTSVSKLVAGRQGLS